MPNAIQSDKYQCAFTCAYCDCPAAKPLEVVISDITGNTAVNGWYFFSVNNSKVYNNTNIKFNLTTLNSSFGLFNNYTNMNSVVVYTNSTINITGSAYIALFGNSNTITKISCVQMLVNINLSTLTSNFSLVHDKLQVNQTLRNLIVNITMPTTS